MFLSLLTLTLALQAAPLTAQEAVKLALKQNPALKAKRAALDETQAASSKAYADFFPKVQAKGGASTRKDALTSANVLFDGTPYNAYSIGAEVDQPIYLGGKLWAQVGQTQSQSKVRTLDLEIQRRDTILETLKAFYSVLLKKEVLELRKEMVTTYEAVLKQAQRRFRAGKEKQVSLLSFRTQVSLARPQVEVAKNELALAAATLTTAMGEEDLQVLAIDGELTPPNWKELEESLKAQAPRRAELEQTLGELEELESIRSATLSEHLPQVGLKGEWSRQANKKANLLDGDATQWSVGLNLSIPLFSGLSSVHERKRLDAQRAQKEHHLALQRQQFNQEQVLNRQKLLSLQEILKGQTQALKQSREAVAAARKTYRRGTAELREVNDAQKSYLDSRLQHLQSQYDSLVAMMETMKSQGWDLMKLVERL